MISLLNAILGLWNKVFLFSNLGLFIFLPFSYLFAESSEFLGYRKGVIARAYETFTVFSILAVTVLGLTYVLSLYRETPNYSLSKLISKCIYT